MLFKKLFAVSLSVFVSTSVLSDPCTLTLELQCAVPRANGGVHVEADWRDDCTAFNEVDLRYTITNTGVSPINLVCAGDDNATPANQGDDVLVTPANCDTVPTLADPLNTPGSRVYMRTALLSSDSTFTGWASGHSANEANETCSATNDVTILMMLPPTPTPKPVPTLPQWALIMLILGMVGVVGVRRKV